MLREQGEHVRVRGGQAIIHTLERLGVDVVFGIPGVHTLEIYDALYDSPIRHVLARHEQGVGFMADGYARASGRPGVAIVITGPGVTNVATPFAEAYADSSPVLVIASNVEQAWQGQMLGHLHDLRDQLGLMRSITPWAKRAHTVQEIPCLLHEALAFMLGGRSRPAYLEVPLDVLSAEADIDVASLTPITRPVMAPSPEIVAVAAKTIATARRVVIYAGGGAVASQAGAELAALAEWLHAPVLTSTQGKGSIPDDHPYSVGNLWEPGNPVENLLREADLVLIFGSKLGAMETNYQQMPLPPIRIRVDADPQEILRNYPPTIPIVADCRLTARALLEALRHERLQCAGWSPDEVAAVRQKALARAWGHEQAAYIRAIRSALPRDGILVVDMTMMGYVANRFYPVYTPRSYLFPTGYGTLGFALPAAIGAKIARPDVPVVALVGDGGFQYTMEELGAAVQLGIGLPIILCNDSAYTAVKDEQARRFDRRFIAVDLVNPDFQRLAAAYGIPSVRVASPEQLQDALSVALERSVPTVIELPVSFPV